MDYATLVVLLAILFAFLIYGVRLMRSDSADTSGESDVGSAILDFARAFPGEAVRSLHMTADHEAVFVRLHDNRSGFMRNMGNHHACLMLDPKTLHLEVLDSGDGLRVAFDDWPKFNGDYLFQSQEEAADVALWLLASLQVEAEAIVEDEAALEEAHDELDAFLEEQARNDGDVESDPLAEETSGPDVSDLRF